MGPFKALFIPDIFDIKFKVNGAKVKKYIKNIQINEKSKTHKIKF